MSTATYSHSYIENRKKIIKRWYYSAALWRWVISPFYHFCRFRYMSHCMSPLTYIKYSFYRAVNYSTKRGLAIVCRLSVCPSVTLVDCDHTCWESWKLIARTISPTPSLFVVQRPSTNSQGNMGKFCVQTLNMGFEYVEYCVFIDIRPCEPVVTER